MAFSSQVRHQFDDKFRIRIPAKYREGLGADYIFVIGDQKCINVYPRAAFDARVDRMMANAHGETQVLRAIRYILGTVEDEIKEDNQGRITISAFFRNFLKLNREERDLVTIGMQDHIEIWKASDYDATQDEFADGSAYKIAGFYS